MVDPRIVGIDEARTALAASVFEAQMAGHLLAAYRLAYLVLRNAADAEDATHDAVLQAWRQRRNLRDPARFDAWFDSILLNRCRDRLRRARHIRFVPITDDSAGGRLPGADAGLADRDLVARAAMHLSFDQRATVVLRFWADLSVDEIAARLGVPPGTVKSRLHAAMGILRAALDEPVVGGGSR